MCARFTLLPQSALNRLELMPSEQLAPLTKAVLHAKSLKELGLIED